MDASPARRSWYGDQVNRYEKRVRRGAAYLDAVVADKRWSPHRYVNWREKIDLEELNLYSAQDCILGQLSRNFWSTLESHESYLWLIRRGFVVPGDVPGTMLQFDNIGYAETRLRRRELRLRAAWRDYITAEREVKARAQVG